MRPVVYRLSPSHPQFVEYKAGGYANQERFVTDGVRACYEFSRCRREFQHGPGFTLEFQVQVLPAAEDWQKFWRAVDGLKLARWRHIYSQVDVPPGPNGERIVVTDSEEWTLNVSMPRGSWKIQGFGAYPVAGQPERVNMSMLAGEPAKDARAPLEAAFRELLGLPRGGKP